MFRTNEIQKHLLNSNNNTSSSSSSTTTTIRKTQSMTSSNSTNKNNLNNNNNNENLPKCSGTVSSLQRNWNTTTTTTTTSNSQPIPASSLPSWQADESEWPPTSSPPSPQQQKQQKPPLAAISRSKPTTTTASTVTNKNLKNGSKSNESSSAKLLKSFLCNANSNNNSASSALKRSAPSLKRSFPWDTPQNSNPKRSTSNNSNMHKLSSEGTRQSVFGQNHLSNPKMSIAAKVSLSPEQQSVLDHVISGKSIFFTGSAGTGKSVLLRHIISSLKRQYETKMDAVAVTASTGMAACAIGGTTIHSFAGIGLGNENAEQLLSKVKRNRKASGKWMRVKALIIDEVSMLDGELFDKLSYIAQKMKKVDKPFGGIQLIIAGDFFQLPPVSKGKVSFAFNAKKWSECVQHTVNLTQVFRQKDTTFIDMLNEMRTGNLSQASIQRFKQLSRELKFDDGILPTELYPTRNEVERSNWNRLDAIKSNPVIFEAQDTGKGTPDQRRRDFENMMALSKLTLKKGAQVMMIKNQSSEDGPTWLVNGLVGIVEDFVDNYTTLESYQLSKNEGFGREDDDLFDDEDEDYGKKSLGIYSNQKQPPNRGAVKREGLKPNETNNTNGKQQRYTLPVVRWFLPNGKNEFTIVERTEFKVENAEGEVQSRRVQIPLILAWAMSIHKSQGQTLNRVKVDLGRVFEKGQIYVALSRATSLDGLQVLRFDHRKVMAHPEVVKWSKDNLISPVLEQ